MNRNEATVQALMMIEKTQSYGEDEGRVSLMAAQLILGSYIAQTDLSLDKLLGDIRSKLDMVDAKLPPEDYRNTAPKLMTKATGDQAVELAEWLTSHEAWNHYTVGLVLVGTSYMEERFRGVNKYKLRAFLLDVFRQLYARNHNKETK